MGDIIDKISLKSLEVPIFNDLFSRFVTLNFLLLPKTVVNIWENILKCLTTPLTSLGRENV